MDPNLELLEELVKEECYEKGISEHKSDKRGILKKDWEKYFINLNLSETRLKDTTSLSEKVKQLKNIYPELEKFKKVGCFNQGSYYLDPFFKYAKKYPEECRDVILDGSHFDGWDDFNCDIPYFKTLNIFNKDFCLIYNRNYMSDTVLIFLFFNDPRKIHDLFFKEDNLKYGAGIYELGLDNRSNFILNKVDLKYIEDPILDEKITEALDKDITCFFNNKDFYKNNTIQPLPYKRGLIIFGPHGNGKTTFVKHILGKYPNTHRLLVDTGKLFSPDLFEYIKHVFPEKSKKIIVFEDVESISQGNEGRSYALRSSFLNFIDGAKTLENIMFLATTNHPDLIDPALIDRPSRFDKRYFIGLPTEKSRKRFLIKFFPELKEKSNEQRLKQLVKDTKNFSGAYFKELFIMVGIQQTTLENAVKLLNKQIKSYKDKKFDPDQSRGIGLGASINEEY